MENQRELKLGCHNCSNMIDVDKQYPPGPIPRTLELWCKMCHTISLFYLHPPWPKAE